MHNHEPSPRDNSVPPSQQEEEIRALLLRLLRLVAAEVARVFHKQNAPPPLQGGDQRDEDIESDS